MAVAFFAYTYFFKKSDTGTPVTTLVTTTDTGEEIPVQPIGTTGMNQIEIGNEFLTTLLSVNKITLDSTIFTSDVFNSLKDYHVTLVSEGNEGRPNPFAPIGIDVTGSTLIDTVTTNIATDISKTISTLNGSVLSSNQITSTWFEWGTTLNLGKKTTGNNDIIISGDFQEILTNLLPNTTYYFRAASKIGENTVYGETISLKTLQ